jgi:hypothetical protein
MKSGGAGGGRGEGKDTLMLEIRNEICAPSDLNLEVLII